MHSFWKRVKDIAARDCGIAGTALCYRGWGVPKPECSEKEIIGDPVARPENSRQIQLISRGHRGLSAWTLGVVLTMPSERRVGLKDVLALLSVFVFAFAFGLGLMLLIGFALAPIMLGPPDQPIQTTGRVPLFLTLVIFILAAGAILGGIVWVAVAGLVLPRETMHRWLYTGPQIPYLTDLCLDVLDAVTGHKKRP